MNTSDTSSADRLAQLRQHPNYQRIAGPPAAGEDIENFADAPPDPGTLSIFSISSQPSIERPKLEDSALHGPAGEIIRRLAPHTEADPAAMYAQLLTGLGSLIGPGAWFVADGARHHVNLFTVIAGRTAKARKGTSWARVRNVLHELDDLWFTTRVKSGVVSGEGIVEAFREDEQGEKRLLLMEGEFGQVLQSMKREGSTVSVLLRNAWDGSRIAVMRRKDPFEVDGAHISMIGHITLPELHRLLASVDISNGLANRCLWVFADRKQLLPLGSSHPDLDEPLEQIHAAIQKAGTRGQVKLDASAEDLWCRVYGELSEEPQGTLGEVISRGEAQVMRVALLLALLDRAATIECRHLEAAMAFWRYCAASAAVIFAGQISHPKSRKILEALQAGGSLSMAQIYKLFGNRAAKSDIEQALAELAGKIHIHKAGGQGGAILIRLAGTS